MENRYMFRAKRIDNGEWIVGSLIQTPYLGSIRSWISSEQEDKARLREISSNQAVWRAFEVRTDTICQCTGLNDRNGKMIWENDIVQYEGILFVVKWNYACAHFEACEIRERIRRTPVMNRGTMKITEVVGNIFDNPELMEVEE